MKNLLITTLIGATLVAGAAFAADQSDVAADKGAIAKDNTAIANQNGNIAANRAAKADAKANGNVGDQAVASTKIGVNKTVRAEKSDVEKPVDQKILNHDQANQQ